MTKQKTRKPMDKLDGFDSREAMWAEIRKMGTFTVRDLYERTTLTLENVRDYVTGLTKGGFLSSDKDTEQELIVGCSPRKAVTFTLVRNVGIDAPRVRKDGTTVVQGQGVANMWRTMRILGTFSARELAFSASTETCVVSVGTAQTYAIHLCHAGYLLKVKGAYRFRPTMHTGPKPPMIQRVKRVWDPNLKKVMWSEEAITNDELRMTNEGGLP